ncbi:hypothetical protein TNCV_2457251 [Trichonephila clavipes]|nr:hypothetical protein TNCV_2457251 [Trichonephila clavipes]
MRTGSITSTHRYWSTNRWLETTELDDCDKWTKQTLISPFPKTVTAGSDVVQSGRPIFDDFFQHLWLYIGNKTANVVFRMVKRLWLIRKDQ